MIRILTPGAGTYTVVAHDYPGTVNNTPNDVTVDIYLNGTLEWSETRTVTTEGTYYYFAQVEFPSGTVTTCPNTGC